MHVAKLVVHYEIYEMASYFRFPEFLEKHLKKIPEKTKRKVINGVLT